MAKPLEKIVMNIRDFQKISLPYHDISCRPHPMKSETNYNVEFESLKGFLLEKGDG